MNLLKLSCIVACLSLPAVASDNGIIEVKGDILVEHRINGDETKCRLGIQAGVNEHFIQRWTRISTEDFDNSFDVSELCSRKNDIFKLRKQALLNTVGGSGYSHGS